MVDQIVQGTNPTLTFVLPMSTSTLTNIEMTISARNGEVKIKKTSATYSGYNAMIQLLEDDTLNLPPDKYNVQLRVKNTNGTICATRYIPIEVLPLASKAYL